jgi:uncharacterized membrane protein YeiH
MTPGLVLEAAAVIAASMSAMITAAKKNMDLVGVYALALVTSFGGGTIRDLLIDRRPFFWVQNWQYLVIVFVLCVGFVYSRNLYRLSTTFVARADIIDALGLGLFTISGTTLAAHADLPAPVCALLGVVTTTGGGVMRDLIINEVPTLFQHGRMHATTALAGATLFLVLLRAGLSEPTAALIATPFIVVARLGALWLGTTLPRPHWLDSGRWRTPQ